MLLKSPVAPANLLVPPLMCTGRLFPCRDAVDSDRVKDSPSVEKLRLATRDPTSALPTIHPKSG